ncbi:mycothiol system anti-sigma-R factor [Corynebacterium glyciniphilum]|jgi:anti-sigma factor (TIGR02949 family)|uniref:mycothiol system anti-sigma-R factor n=2 Tax=Corynebacteriaceae TaxID=1653 RepID=UPI000AFB048D|nr:mycothiol system anti-sigma-R factor [Corynebacterium glyciniphilum]MDN5682761.1 mycothiol system anti-sigma-R factor [Corynebacterium glyciniphilum]
MSDNPGNMSDNPCSASGKSECDELVEVLYEYIDVKTGDCEGEQYRRVRARLEQHVDECPSCLEALGIEQQVRELLRSRCGGQAPQELRGRIITSLQSTVTTSVRIRYSE